MKTGTFMSVAIMPLVLMVFSGSAVAETAADYLKAFHENPAAVMQRLPSWVDENGNVRRRGVISEREVERRFSDRKAARAHIIGRRADSSIIGGEVPDSKDVPEKLVEPGSVIVRNLPEMDARALTRGVVPVLPWTDSYWPMYRGIIGYRYADKSFPKSKNWQTNYQYVQANPASSIVATGDTALINALSPAEKYDFVLGDTNFTLTHFSWATGEKHFLETGSVASWMGICHGWSGAAHMQSAITEIPVEVTASNGVKVTFFPQDVKALQSMLWANASPPTRFVGNRCDTPKPPKNAYGRILDPNCFDTNPGTWHTAVVNQLGINQRSFVMDSTYDAQVWNFSLSKYKYKYINPQTFQETTSLAKAVIPIERYTLDKFKEFRSPGARFVVVVAMDASYVSDTAPTRANKVEPALKTLRFIYDLELDENYNIIGGEWYSNAHPDFMWTFDKSAQAMAPGDAQLANADWTLASPVPADWVAPAQRAASRGAPLFAFIRRLVGAP